MCWCSLSVLIFFFTIIGTCDVFIILCSSVTNVFMWLKVKFIYLFQCLYFPIICCLFYSLFLVLHIPTLPIPFCPYIIKYFPFSFPSLSHQYYYPIFILVSTIPDLHFSHKLKHLSSIYLSSYLPRFFPLLSFTISSSNLLPSYSSFLFSHTQTFIYLSLQDHILSFSIFYLHYSNTCIYYCLCNL